MAKGKNSDNVERKAIEYIVGRKIGDFHKEAKGYAYKFPKGKKWYTIKTSKVDDVIKHHEKALTMEGGGKVPNKKRWVNDLIKSFPKITETQASDLYDKNFKGGSTYKGGGEIDGELDEFVKLVKKGRENFKEGEYDRYEKLTDVLWERYDDDVDEEAIETSLLEIHKKQKSGSTYQGGGDIKKGKNLYNVGFSTNESEGGFGSYLMYADSIEDAKKKFESLESNKGRKVSDVSGEFTKEFKQFKTGGSTYKGGGEITEKEAFDKWVSFNEKQNVKIERLRNSLEDPNASLGNAMTSGSDVAKLKEIKKLESDWDKNKAFYERAIGKKLSKSGSTYKGGGEIKVGDEVGLRFDSEYHKDRLDSFVVEKIENDTYSVRGKKNDNTYSVPREKIIVYRSGSTYEGGGEITHIQNKNGKPAQIKLDGETIHYDFKGNKWVTSKKNQEYLNKYFSKDWWEKNDTPPTYEGGGEITSNWFKGALSFLNW